MPQWRGGEVLDPRRGDMQLKINALDSGSLKAQGLEHVY